MKQCFQTTSQPFFQPRSSFHNAMFSHWFDKFNIKVLFTALFWPLLKRVHPFQVYIKTAGHDSGMPDYKLLTVSSCVLVMK